jgi:5-methyltetrahydrofolate--homocysteine methyltransferase
MTVLLEGKGESPSLDPAGQIRVIGECINPSGRKRLQQALASRDRVYVASEAQQQVEAGADIIDVNACGPGIDEVTIPPGVVRAVAEAVAAPLSIDTRVPAAPEAAFAVSTGRPLGKSIVTRPELRFALLAAGIFLGQASAHGGLCAIYEARREAKARKR